MATFNLSLAIPNTPVSDVQASTQYTKKYDPKQGIPVEQTVTDGGISIDKSQAPALKLDGPVGHLYTQILDRELSLESMGAIVAAVDTSIDPAAPPNPYDGKVTVTSQGASVDSDPNTGYIYIANADTMESSALREVSSRLIDQRLKNPKGKLGLGLMTQGKASPVTESIAATMEALGVKVVYSEAGLRALAREMMGK